MVAERLRRGIEEHSWSLRPITISLGVATMNSSCPCPSILIEQADRSLYQSKALGRNRATHAGDSPSEMFRSSRVTSDEASLTLAGLYDSERGLD
jgi:hypothetical protein